MNGTLREMAAKAIAGHMLDQGQLCDSLPPGIEASAAIDPDAGIERVLARRPAIEPGARGPRTTAAGAKTGWLSWKGPRERGTEWLVGNLTVMLAPGSVEHLQCPWDSTQRDGGDKEGEEGEEDGRRLRARTTKEGHSIPTLKPLSRAWAHLSTDAFSAPARADGLATGSWPSSAEFSLSEPADARRITDPYLRAVVCTGPSCGDTANAHARQRASALRTVHGLLCLARAVATPDARAEASATEEHVLLEDDDSGYRSAMAAVDSAVLAAVAHDVETAGPERTELVLMTNLTSLHLTVQTAQGSFEVVPRCQVDWSSLLRTAIRGHDSVDADMDLVASAHPPPHADSNGSQANTPDHTSNFAGAGGAPSLFVGADATVSMRRHSAAESIPVLGATRSPSISDGALLPPQALATCGRFDLSSE